MLIKKEREAIIHWQQPQIALIQKWQKGIRYMIYDNYNKMYISKD